MGLTITIRLDPRSLSASSQRVYRIYREFSKPERPAEIVTRTIRKAGFTVAIETGAGFDAYRDWDLTIDGHTIRARTPLSEALNYSGLAATILGDCECTDNPCLCSERGQDAFRPVCSPSS